MYTTVDSVYHCCLNTQTAPYSNLHEITLDETSFGSVVRAVVIFRCLCGLRGL